MFYFTGPKSQVHRLSAAGFDKFESVSTCNKKYMKGKHHDIMGKWIGCNGRIPCGNNFKSWLLYFSSSYSLMHLEKQQEIVQVLRSLHTYRTLDKTPCSWFQPGHVLALVAIWQVNQRMADLSPCVSISMSIILPFNKFFKLHIKI